MANAFLPVPRTWRILETDSYRQLALPKAPREFPDGSAMWLNRYTSSNLIDSWIESALNSVLQKREKITRDLGGTASTSEFADAIIAAL